MNVCCNVVLVFCTRGPSFCSFKVLANIFVEMVTLAVFPGKPVGERDFIADDGLHTGSAVCAGACMRVR